MLKVLILIFVFSTNLLAKDFLSRFKVVTSFGDYSYEIIYDEKDQVFASKVKNILLKNTHTLSQYFRYAPQDLIHIVINSDTVIANGSAQVIPTNIISLYNFPPSHYNSLNMSSNWEEVLVVHELAHIIHMDQTRSFLKYMRYIFGTIGKLGGITPRWFTEGVATWAESEFTHSGRLRDPLIQYEVELKLKDPTFCQEIDCLDEPGQYPYGHTPYWVGAHFLKYLEHKNAGTIRCLIEKNSETIPFNLNRAFGLCLQRSLFDKFREFRKSLRSQSTSLDSATYLQKGIQIYKDNLLSVVFENDDPLIKVQNRYLKPPFRTENIQAQDSLLVSATPNLETRVWYEYDKEFKEIPDIESKAAYVFPYQKQYLQLVYVHDHWELKKNKKTLKRFNSSLRFPHLKDDILFYQSHYSFYVLDLKTLKDKNLFSSKDPFNILTYCGKKALIRFQDQSLGLIGPKGLKTYNGPKVLLASSDDDSLYLITAKKKIKTTCSSFEKNFILATKESEKKETDSLITLERESYPSWYHFLPHYWFFSYTGGGNYLEKWSFFTTLSDPAKDNEISLNYDIYPEINKTPLNLKGRHNWNDFSFGYLYQKEYSKSGLSSEPNSDRVMGFNTSYTSKYRHLETNYYLLAVEQERKDFLSEQTKKGPTFSLQFSFLKKPRYKNEFLNTFFFFIRPSYREQKDFRDYFLLETQLKLSLKPTPFQKIGLRSNYGKIFKDGLRDGVLFGGGEGSIIGESFYRFLAIAYSDVFGNQIWTSTLEWDVETFRPNTAGGGLFPFYVKKVNTLIGLEHLKADRVFLNNRIYKSEDLFGGYIGARFDTTLFYVAPVTLDLVYAKVLNKQSDVDQVRLLVKSSFEI